MDGRTTRADTSLTPDELEELDCFAAGAGMRRSPFLRLLLLDGLLRYQANGLQAPVEREAKLARARLQAVSRELEKTQFVTELLS